MITGHTWSVLSGLSGETGWDRDSQTSLLLEFIESKNMDDEFIEFIQERADSEMSLDEEEEEEEDEEIWVETDDDRIHDELSGGGKCGE
jgi:hypothetical protein